MRAGQRYWEIRLWRKTTERDFRRWWPALLRLDDNSAIEKFTFGFSDCYHFISHFFNEYRIHNRGSGHKPSAMTIDDCDHRPNSHCWYRSEVSHFLLDRCRENIPVPLKGECNQKFLHCKSCDRTKMVSDVLSQVQCLKSLTECRWRIFIVVVSFVLDFRGF